MPPKKMLIALAVAAAAVVAYLWYRRRHPQTASGLAVPPSPQTALAVLQSAPPGDVFSAALASGAGYVASKLPGQVGAGVQAVIPQTSVAKRPCEPGYVGFNPTNPSEYCAGVVTGSRYGGAAAAAATAPRNSFAEFGFFG